MHQQPPKTPLLRSTSAANAGQADSSSALTLSSGTTMESYRLGLVLHPRDAIELGSSRLGHCSGMTPEEVRLNLAEADEFPVLLRSLFAQGSARARRSDLQ